MTIANNTRGRSSTRQLDAAGDLLVAERDNSPRGDPERSDGEDDEDESPAAASEAAAANEDGNAPPQQQPPQRQPNISVARMRERVVGERTGRTYAGDALAFLRWCVGNQSLYGILTPYALAKMQEMDAEVPGERKKARNTRITAAFKELLAGARTEPLIVFPQLTPEIFMDYVASLRKPPDNIKYLRSLEASDMRWLDSVPKDSSETHGATGATANRRRPARKAWYECKTLCRWMQDNMDESLVTGDPLQPLDSDTLFALYESVLPLVVYYIGEKGARQSWRTVYKNLAKAKAIPTKESPNKRVLLTLDMQMHIDYIKTQLASSDRTEIVRVHGRQDLESSDEETNHNHNNTQRQIDHGRAARTSGRGHRDAGMNARSGRGGRIRRNTRRTGHTQQAQHNQQAQQHNQPPQQHNQTAHQTQTQRDTGLFWQPPTNYNPDSFGMAFQGAAEGHYNRLATQLLTPQFYAQQEQRRMEREASRNGGYYVNANAVRDAQEQR